MAANDLATADDIARMLGDLDPLTVDRLLAIGATVDELEEAVRELEDERDFSDVVVAPSPRISELRAVLRGLLAYPNTERATAQ